MINNLVWLLGRNVVGKTFKVTVINAENLDKAVDEINDNGANNVSYSSKTFPAAFIPIV